MGKAKKKASTGSDGKGKGADATTVLVVAFFGIAVGAALALFPSEEQWKGPPRRDPSGRILPPGAGPAEVYGITDLENEGEHGKGGETYEDGVDSTSNDYVIAIEEAGQEDDSPPAQNSAPVKNVDLEEGGAISAGSAAAKAISRYGVGTNVGEAGAAELQEAMDLSTKGRFEEALRKAQRAYQLAVAPDLKRRAAYSLLLKWKQPCIDLDRGLCGAAFLQPTLEAILENMEELQLEGDDIFNIAYIMQSNGEFESAMKYYALSEELAEPGGPSSVSALVNQAVVGRLLGLPKLAEAAERRRWDQFEFPQSHRNFQETSRCDHASGLHCKDWAELWERTSIPEPISRANQLPVRSKVRTLDVKHTSGAATERICLPQVDTGHLVLNDVSVYGRELWIYDDCTVFTCGMRLTQRDSQDPALQALQAPREVVKLDRAAVLPPKHMKNFYHYAIEGMSNLALLFDQIVPNIPSDPLPNQDKPLVLLVGASKQADRLFAYEMFVMLSKIRPDIVATLMWYDVRNRYDIGELHMVDWYPAPDPIETCPEDTVPLHPSYDMYYGPCEIVETHASVLNRAASRKTPLQDTIVYYSRSTSPRNDRRIVNEELLLSQLKDRVTAFNIEHGTKYRVGTHDGTLTVEEQVKLMRRAKIAFGTHGASMSTIIHAQPGTALIEFPLLEKDDIQHFFRHLAACAGVEYYVADGLGCSFYGNLELSSPEHDKGIADFLATIERILLSALPEE